MERKDVNTFYTSKAAGKIRNLRNILVIVCKSRNQDEAYPDGSLATGQPPRKIQGGAIVHPGKVTMALRVPRLYIQQNKIDLLQLCVRKAITESAVRIQRGVNSHQLRASEQLDGESVLHQRLASTQRESAGHRLQSVPVLTKFFRCLRERQRNAIAHVPGVRIMAIQASK